MGIIFLVAYFIWKNIYNEYCFMVYKNSLYYNTTVSASGYFKITFWAVSKVIRKILIIPNCFHLIPKHVLISWLSETNARDVRDMGLIPGLGRFPREEQGNWLKYSCLENPMDRGGWQATVHRISKRRTQLKRLNKSILEKKVNQSSLSFSMK